MVTAVLSANPSGFRPLLGAAAAQRIRRGGGPGTVRCQDGHTCLSPYTHQSIDDRLGEIRRGGGPGTVRCQDGHTCLSPYTHQSIDDRLGDELMALNPPITNEAGRDPSSYRPVATRSRERSGISKRPGTS
jgi:hypothetical protein